MPQVRKSGTAWGRRLDDYAYTTGLDGPGWAWEFLRRNDIYIRDFRANRAGAPLTMKHSSGAKILRLRRQFLAAEKWGLQLFANPNISALDSPVFWIPAVTQHVVTCTARAANDNQKNTMSLAAFGGQRAALVTSSGEYITLHQQQTSACMVVKNSTFLIGESALTFEISGLNDVKQACETLKILNDLHSDRSEFTPAHSDNRSKYLDYLVALDGRLAGRSYRDIAEVLYGCEHIGSSWTDDSRGFKSKVRRAVESGLALMNGGYRDLL
jgi:Uncharacterized conserved protein (DUF2285)/Family of unknown function (DUF6499)